MNVQGKPVSNTRSGRKNTSDPKRLDVPIDERAGPIAKDSLAAESTQAGGIFSQNKDSQPSGVCGNRSTFNNTDTSGASTLPSSNDASSRDDLNRMQRYPEAMGGQGEYPGTHLPTTGYVGGPTQEKKRMGIFGHQHYTDTNPVEEYRYKSPYNAGPTSTYITPIGGNPHGKNLREGGFDSNPNANASFTSDIGTNKDPGRLAENGFQRRLAKSARDAAYDNKQERIQKDDQLYALLARNERI